MRSPGLRFLIVGLLALLMFVPVNLVSDVVQSRADYSRNTIQDVSEEWGGAQLLSGPLLLIPVEEPVVYDRRREVVDPETGRVLRDEDDKVIYEHYQETVVETRPAVHLYPDDLAIDIATTGEVRHRGIFNVPVYSADVHMTFAFTAAAAGELLKGDERLFWDHAELQVYLSENRALRGDAKLTADGTSQGLDPLPDRGDLNGIFARVGDPRGLASFDLSFRLNGAQNLGAAATGRTTRLTIASDWPHPSFTGTFLPDASDVTETGFSATWTIPHLARALPQAARENPEPAARRIATMQVDFITPNDFYQKAYRSARYAILFIALTFLTILLLDRTSARPAHPVQYLMVGLAQSVFVLLMVSYAEQIGFGPAYLLSAGATIGLLAMFGATALRMGRRTLVLTALLVVLYVVLYLILRSADHALIAGSTLAFGAIAGTMILTRNEDWYGPERAPGQGRGWFGRGTPAAPAPPAV